METFKAVFQIVDFILILAILLMCICIWVERRRANKLTERELNSLTVRQQLIKDGFVPYNYEADGYKYPKATVVAEIKPDIEDNKLRYALLINGSLRRYLTEREVYVLIVEDNKADNRVLTDKEVRKFWS